MKVLIIDDDQFIRTVYSASLNQENIEAITAENGDLGIELARKEKPDLILLDMLMPVKTGFEILAEIKKDNELKNIPIIVISALSQESDINTVKEMGINEYMPKDSFNIRDVINAVKKIIVK